MPRNPFAFLDNESEHRRLLLFLQAIVRKNGGEIRLTVSDITAVEDGCGLFRSPQGDELVLRFAEKGAEVYFLTESEPRQTRINSRSASPIPSPPLEPRHAIHNDIDLAMREEEMANKAKAAEAQRVREARAAAGAQPWRTVKPQ